MKNVLIFLGGATLGGVAATVYFKRKIILLEEEYQLIATEEIEKALNVCDDEKQKPCTIIEDKSIENNEFVKAVSQYDTLSKNIEPEMPIEEDAYDEKVALYFITPDEYGDDDEYETKILTIFTDGIVVDEDNCIFDIEYFGKDIFKELTSKSNKHANDVFYVRDDNDNIDFEIIKESIDFDTFSKFTTPDDK